MDQKKEIADRIKQANNILVTVSNNPSVDQLASCIGLTLAFNKMGKHATAVFSGAVPSTLEFLEPEKTLEASTDSLRDFIISLDKAKADKLRYKVEDTVVKIFITPYRTSISDKDLEFSQGDFNVDAVIALGVHQQSELDQAITSHGRILHDATVITVNVKPGGELGSINWLVPGASSLSELAVDLLDAIDKSVVDEQIATALLTGIVAETQRFSNEKTSPDTMSISAELMAAGANQQLVATKLEEPKPEPPAPQPMPSTDQDQPSAAEPPKPAEENKPDGTLEIVHTDQPEEKKEAPKDDEDKRPIGSIEDLAPKDGEEKKEEEKEAATPRIHIDDQGSLHTMEEMAAKEAEAKKDASTDPNGHIGGGSRMILQPPSTSPSASPSDAFSDPLTLPQPSEKSSGEPAVSPSPFVPQASANITPPAMPFMPPSMTPSASPPPGTLDPMQPPAGSPAFPTNEPSASAAMPAPDTSHVDNARNAVMDAISSQPQPDRPEPIQALNAQPLGDILHSQSQPMASDNTPPDLTSGAANPDFTPALPGGLNMPEPVGTPPPVPPPMMPTQPQ